MIIFLVGIMLLTVVKLNTIKKQTGITLRKKIRIGKFNMRKIVCQRCGKEMKSRLGLIVKGMIFFNLNGNYTANWIHHIGPPFVNASDGTRLEKLTENPRFIAFGCTACGHEFLNPEEIKQTMYNRLTFKRFGNKR